MYLLIFINHSDGIVLSGSYYIGNGSKDAINDFKAQHKCNHICRALGLSALQ